jgi:hypothetical protein
MIGAERRGTAVEEPLESSRCKLKNTLLKNPELLEDDTGRERHAANLVMR